MDGRRACLVDAFTDEPFAGNAAGVVPDAADLSAAQMQAISRELSASETAFLSPSEDADRRIRYFTPTQEVELCGHATIASHALLAADGAIEPGTHRLETNVGVLDIELQDDGVVWMTQSRPEVETVEIDYERLADALGIDPAKLRDVGADLPVARATTGLPFLIVPVNFLEALSDVQPDLQAIEAITDEYDATGIYAFTFDTLESESTLHGRMFAPGAGVDEDPVTGTASGACGAYLDAYEAFDELPDDLRFEQGHFVDRGGIVRVDVSVDDRGRKQVRVGGEAAVALDGTLAIPDAEDDEIIEA
ncbi:PhzF family phenazine biosynthesis protein [Halonotius terrestris]|uniref:PhzF family phenazine biosynthesis protein n=1 Tax=Halonotius terrestris TaxID=2487750 RepID=A0A8J8PB84_9EURY|nr:PhzF family phenazine biosynthesis protein [Halonotius terrestris]TQQ83542.1 PhzF family phenazine biosynthesis protein [Halonotius terrestris]